MSNRFTGLFIIFAHCICGCCHDRMVVAVDLNHAEENIQTRFRYRLFNSQLDYDNWLKGNNVWCLSDTMAKYYPNVFSKDGIPILCELVNGQEEKRHRKWPANEGEELLCLLYELPTFFTLPANYGGYTSCSTMRVKILGNNSKKSESFRVFEQQDEIVSAMSPLAWLFFQGNPVPETFENAHVFEGHRWNRISTSTNVRTPAIAYAIAASVMQLERLSIVTDKTLSEANASRQKAAAARLANAEKKKARQTGVRFDSGGERQVAVRKTDARNEIQSNEVTYRVVRLERNSSNDFYYSFAVELIGEDGKDPLSGFRKVQHDFRTAILNDYMATYANCELGSVRVDFHGLKQNAQRVEGSAVVLFVRPISLRYDALTRKGILSVRFGANQYEEARAFAKRNIETLARDKNIALVTGQLPPEARYYSLGEKLKDGNVLEIEFKTE